MSSDDRHLSLSSKPDDQESHRPGEEWNNTASSFPHMLCVHELFAQQAALTPAAVAVAMGDDCITYAKLNDRADQAAHFLRSVGVGPDVVVGLCVERSIEMVVSMLAILKAGGAYLPLDQNYPHERIAFMLKDAGASVVVASATTYLAVAAHGVHTITLDFEEPADSGQLSNPPLNASHSNNLVYVMYTSGSSGTPKGVAVVHHNVTRLVRNTNYVAISAQDVFLHLAPVTFDAATFEIWGALLNGARLVLYAPEQLLNYSKLKTVIYENGVSVLWLTAGLFNSIVDADLSMLAPVRQLLVGGDAVSATHVRRFLSEIHTCTVINGYGPTEGTTFSVCFPILDLSAIEDTVPIGRPISNTTLYVLDTNGQIARKGTIGELYIGGYGLARGYCNQADLTAELFLPNPFGDPGSRLYRTGDMVRFTGQDVLEFVGRLDSQVKVRGYRIELEEVESALLSDPHIRQAVVVVQPEKHGDKRLIAYVVGPHDVPSESSRIRQNISLRLPEYMVPSVVIVLDALPLTANGKVDRNALPLPESRMTGHLPHADLEQAIAEIWALNLGVPSVGLDDDFFDLGGTSLALINVVVEMSERFSTPLDTSIVALGATVRALAAGVRDRTAAGNQQGATIEQAIAEIWSSALGVPSVELNDDFFDLGGTSLALIRVVVEMSNRFSIPLDTSIVAQGATVCALAAAVRNKMNPLPAHSEPIEQAIAEIWSSTLGVPSVGLNDDFFDLGGTSLALINVVVEMSNRFSIPLDTSIVAQGSTVCALAAAIKERSRESLVSL